MDDKIKNYYKKNFLFAGHRMVMPISGDKFKHNCGDCKYFVKVIGYQKTRNICLANVKAYKNRHKQVPDTIEIVELMLLLGKEVLQELMGKGGQHSMACGTFEQRIT